MNRYDEPGFDDALGQWVCWSLRGDSVGAEPSAAAWLRLSRRVQNLGAPCDERGLTRALTVLRRVEAFARGNGLSVWHALGHIWRTIDENTVSSEAMWDTEVSSSLRALQLAHEQLFNVWPVFGLMKTPIY